MSVLSRLTERWLRAIVLRSLGEAISAYVATVTAVGGLGVGHGDAAAVDGLLAGHAQTAGGAAAGAAVVLRVVLPALVRLSDRLRGITVPDVPLDDVPLSDAYAPPDSETTYTWTPLDDDGDDD